MIELSPSLKHWLLENHPDKLTLIMFGHTEYMTDEMWDEYAEWIRTGEGMNYKENDNESNDV